MPYLRQIAFSLLLSITLISCRRDPTTAKKQYLESGNRYFEHGNYRAAAIQYNNAIKIDPKFGPAHYKLAEVAMKQTPPQVVNAIHEYRRAQELLKGNQAYQEEYRKTLVQLADILNAVNVTKYDDALASEAQVYCNDLLNMDANSFDGLRLSGDGLLAHAKSVQLTTPSITVKDLADAMDFYRKAEAIKPNDSTVALQIGNVLVAQKHAAEAEPYFRKVLSQAKTNPIQANDAAYGRLYQLYMSTGKTAEAERVWKDAVQNNPKEEKYLVELAKHYARLGRKDDMVNTLQEIKSHAKEWQAVYQTVGNFYLSANDPESALREYNDGVNKDPKNKSTYRHSIIDVLVRQGKRAEAAEVNEQILKENPKDSDALSLRAQFQLDSGDVANALTQLQSITTNDPNNAHAHYELGRAYLASNRPESREAARQQFEKAIALRPDMINPRLGLAELQVSHGEYQAGLDTAQAVLNMDPNNFGAKLIQSKGLLGLKKYGESDNLVAAMLKSNPSSPEAYYQKGVNELSQGRPKDAEADFVRAYQLNPTVAKGLMGVVDADIQQGKPEAAMQMLSSESKKAPNRMDLIFLMGLTAQREGKYGDAFNYFNQVLNGLDKKSKVRANLYMEIANNYRLAGDRDNSIANYMKAREILPDNETVLAALGLVLDQANRRPEARKVYEAALRVGPNNPFVLNNLAYLMAEAGSDMDVALNYAQKAKSLDPNKPEISDTLGWILLKKSLSDQAIPVFQDLATRYPQVSTYHYHLAMAYQQKGDLAKSAEELREALKHSPDQGEQQKIQDMLSHMGK